MAKSLSDKYFKGVYWSEEDNLYIGYCPDLNIRIDCGEKAKPEKVFKELCEVVEFHVSSEKNEKMPILPEPIMEKEYSGKLNLRLGKLLHRSITLKSIEKGLSINKLIINTLEKSLKDNV